MGGKWLHELPDVCRAAGLDVEVYPGWETRSRSSGGYDAVRAVGIHHTAGSGHYPDSDMDYMWKGSSYEPVGAIYLARDGKVTVGAAGATNTQGAGGPVSTSKGTIPLDAGNRYMLSIEAANLGTGDPWPVAQQDAYITLCAALCDEYDLDPLRDIFAHFEWTNRKIDPAGNSRYASGGNKWNMTQFRDDVLEGADMPSADEIRLIVADELNKNNREQAREVWDTVIPQMGLDGKGEPLPDKKAAWYIRSVVRAVRFWIGPTEADEPVPSPTRLRQIREDTKAILKKLG